MKYLYLLLLLFSPFCFSQSKEVLKEFGIKDLELNKTYTDLSRFNKNQNGKYFYDLIDNPYFKKVELSFSEDNRLYYIGLKFKDKKVLKANQSKVLSILIANFGEFKEIPYSYIFDHGTEQADFTNYENNVDLLTGVSLRGVYQNTEVNYDDFDSKYIYTSNGNYKNVYSNKKAEVIVDFLAVKNQGKVVDYFMSFDMTSVDWKDIQRVIFLLDGERFEVEGLTDFNFTKKGNKKESLMIEVKKDLIDKLINSKDSKFRIQGKVNDDFVFNEKLKYALSAFIKSIK
ncbi:hypothetical protein [Empedobacter sp.]|uniref:hypothetical protein n=1 Tax=Empedobacter sp. TaxID=1927715 RepID=UPI0028A1D2A3|nr:hypothetical protein [Empedobacter sp.]